MFLLRFALSGLRSREDIAEYFEMDVEYLENFAEDVGVHSQELENLTVEASENIRKNEDLEGRARQFFLDVMAGDIAWTASCNSWQTGLDRIYVRIGELPIRRRYVKAVERVLNEEISLPEFSAPEDFGLEVDPDFGQGNSLGEAVLLLEWTAYALRNTESALGPGKVESLKKEYFEYYYGDKERMSDEARMFQEALLENAAVWTDGVIDHYGGYSPVFGGISNSLKQGLERVRERK